VLFSAYPAVRRELDLDALDLRYFTAGATIARPGDRSVLVDPRRAPTDALQTLFNGDITFGDKLRLFTLQRELAGRSPGEILNRGGTSTRAYLDRVGFSAKFVDNFAAPLYGGITLDRDLKLTASSSSTRSRCSEGVSACRPRAWARFPTSLRSARRWRGRR